MTIVNENVVDELKEDVKDEARKVGEAAKRVFVKGRREVRGLSPTARVILGVGSAILLVTLASVLLSGLRERE